MSIINHNTIELHFRPDDLEIAFRYKSDKEMKTARMIFNLIRFPLAVKILSAAALLTLRFRLPFKSIIKNTVFKVFCSGENVREALHLIEKLEKYQVLSVLDYVAEGEKNKKAYDHNARMIISNILLLKNLQNGQSISLKLSGLEDVNFIKSLKEKPGSLTRHVKNRLSEFTKRVDEICRVAALHKILVYIDAEAYDTQHIFDEIAELMMSRYNTDRVVIFNSLQMYLKDREKYLEELIGKAREGNYRLGIKLVRGAYLEKEIEYAKSMGLPVPVYQSKIETDIAFNKAVQTCLEHTELIDTCLATHNEESILLAIQIMNKKNLDRNSVKFSQLYGMSDHLTFNLAFAGYNTSKYLPYGPIEKAIPYLIRRAEENTSVGGQMGRELSLLNKELERRRLHTTSHE